ncbi:MAG: DUF6340 family protein [Bacteroidales bacterium]
MNRFSYFIFLSLTLAVGNSCSSLTYFDLPVYQIAETPFPAVEGKIVLVNNAAEQPLRAGSFLVDANNKEQRLLFERDSANVPMLNMLGQQLLNSEFIKDVSIYNTPFRTDSLYRNAQGLNEMQLEEIQRESGADWILSLDAMPHYIEIREKLLPDYNLVKALLQIQLSPVFRLYKAGEKTALKHYYISDTVRWESTQFQLESAISALPPLNDCFLDALYLASEKAIHRWLPYPVTEQRCWIKHPHSVMREATAFFVNGDYESAGYMWEYGYESIKNKKIRYYSAYNRAVLAEINGDLQLAMQWLDKALLVQPENTSLHELNIPEIKKSLKKQLSTQEKLLPLL